MQSGNKQKKWEGSKKGVENRKVMHLIAFSVIVLLCVYEWNQLLMYL